MNSARVQIADEIRRDGIILLALAKAVLPMTITSIGSTTTLTAS